MELIEDFPIADWRYSILKERFGDLEPCEKEYKKDFLFCQGIFWKKGRNI